MKIAIVVLGLSLNVYAAGSPAADKSAAPAQPTIAKACATEIKKFCAKEKGETNIYNCLEKNDKQISKSCDAAHEAYGIANGLEAKDDHK